jgi:hypothetical protein
VATDGCQAEPPERAGMRFLSFCRCRRVLRECCAVVMLVCPLGHDVRVARCARACPSGTLSTPALLRRSVSARAVVRR